MTLAKMWVINKFLLEKSHQHREAGIAIENWISDTCVELAEKT